MFKCRDITGFAKHAHAGVTLSVLVDVALHFVHEVYWLLICRICSAATANSGSTKACFGTTKQIFFVFFLPRYKIDT